MSKKQIVVVSLVFVLGLALVPSSMGMMRTINDSQPVFVDILASNNVSSEKITSQKAKISEEVNKTYICDPTGKTEGYFLEDFSEDFFELMGSRGQTSRHFYNKITKGYTFQSDILVQREGVVDGTPWVTVEEYPHKFYVRLQNGEIQFFETALEISTFLKTIDRTTIWSVGFESFTGLMGFYLDFTDTLHGHGQYIYWPRLGNGKISPYSTPLYAIYPHLYLKRNDTWINQILSDQTLFFGHSQNLRNTLEFYDSETEFSLTFTLSGVKFCNSTWNLKQGFKYWLDDRCYHMITEIECLDQDFDDIGMTYELSIAPQSEDPHCQPVEYLIQNEREFLAIPVQDTWQASQYLENFLPQIDFIAHDVRFQFSFGDMELAGFTEKSLEAHELELPGGMIQKVLSAGMAGYGSYSAGTLIEIDPSTDTLYPTDNYDLYRELNSDPDFYFTTHDFARVGYEFWSVPEPDFDFHYEAFVTWQTGITQEISCITDVSCQLYLEREYVESGEGLSAQIYNIDGNGNALLESDTTWNPSLTKNKDAVLLNPGTGWKTLDTNKMIQIVDYWADYRDDSDQFISFRFYGYNVDDRTRDYIQFDESQNADNKPKLSFTYYTTRSYWALIVSGSADNWSDHDAFNMFNTLIDYYNGFTNDSIYLITYHTTDPVSGDPIPRDKESHVTNVWWAIDQIASSADLCDQVVIWWIGHGTVLEGEEVFGCPADPEDDVVTSTNLDNALDAINCREMFIYLGPCYSGAFIDDLEEENRAIYTSCSSFQRAHVNPTKTHAYWSWATYLSLNDNAPDADDNNDNRVSLWEIFVYSKWRVLVYWDLEKQTPQRWIDPNGKLADEDCYIYDGYYPQ
ncbi:MAG: hypothetical protein ACFFDT_23565 [Candidatus Hodarchaeota archaeon]